MSIHILVTGATGNVGRALSTQLLHTDAEIAMTLASRHGEAVAGTPGRAIDLLDEASTAIAMKGVNRLFLLTPAHPAMEAMTANAITAARAAGVQHVVRVSGAGADPDSDVAIARLQGHCDRLVIDSGIAYTLLRPKNFMQNFATFMRDMVRAGTVYSSQGQGRVPFIDARDIAAVAAQVLTSPQAHAGQAYTLTGPQALNNAEALSIISHQIGREVRLVPIVEDQAVAAMRQSGMPEELVQAMSSLNRIIAAGWVAEVTDAIPRLLGRPAMSFVDFVREHAQVWA